jgi:anti-sigma regulatory factor (Ser/Thr protein kinase)/CheY-like chemotaxis protein
MTSIIGFADYLLDQDLKPDHKEMMRLMNESANHLRRIIDDVLDLSRIESGKLSLLRRNMDLKQAVTDIMDLLEPRAREKGIYPQVQIDPQIPPTLLGDRVRITQIVTNLVHNAIKFTSKGGVTLSVHVEAENDAQVCIGLCVEDTGSGIARENLERVFDAFTQESDGTFESHGGTGLGLTIASRLVALMGGQMSVDSEKGRGTQFFVTLWLERADATAREAEGAPAQTATAAGGVRTARILVTEDNAAIQRLIERNPHEAGSKWEIAADGEEAAQACAAPASIWCAGHTPARHGWLRDRPPHPRDEKARGAPPSRSSLHRLRLRPRQARPRGGMDAFIPNPSTAAAARHHTRSASRPPLDV